MWWRHAAFSAIVVCGLACSRQPGGQVKAPAQDPTGAQLKAPAQNAAPVVAQKRPLGDYPAGSVIQDMEAAGGGGTNQNYPHNLGDKDWGTKGSISVVAFPQEAVDYKGHRGIAVRIVNCPLPRSDRTFERMLPNWRPIPG